MISIRRIVHPTDFSETSRRALLWAMWVAKQNRAELMVVHVLPPPTPIFEIESAERPQAEAQLSALMRKTRWVKVKTKRLLVKGKASVAKHIVECASILQADLIVMGTHGRSGISRLFTGSVASRVIAHAHCPVLVVRGRSTNNFFAMDSGPAYDEYEKKGKLLP